MKSITTGALLLATVGLLAATPDDFDHYIDLEVAGYTGAATLANFPLAVRLSAAQGFSPALVTRADHADLAFFSADGAVEYPCEIDTWTDDGVLVWVRVPALTNGLALKACFGSETATRSTAAADVWTNYAAVWHMNPSAPDSVGGQSIACVGATKATTTDLLGAGYETAARDKNGLSTNYKFDGLGTRFTVSGWFRQQFDDVTMRVFSTKNNYKGNGLEVMFVDAAGKLYMRGSGGSTTLSSDTGKADYFPNKGTWLHLAAAYDDTTGTIFANGETAATGTISAPGNFGYGLGVGNYGSGQSSEVCYLGVMDEVRVYKGVASADLIAAEYATVAKPAFLAYGPVDDDYTAPVFTDAPTITGDGTEVTFSATLAAGVADLTAVVTDVASGVTTETPIATAVEAGQPATVQLTLVEGHSYTFLVRAESASGFSVTKSGASVFVCGAFEPDAFTFRSDSTPANVWNEPNAWTSTSPNRANTVPGVAGDTVTIINATITDGANAIISGLMTSNSRIISDQTETTLTFFSPTGEAVPWELGATSSSGSDNTYLGSLYKDNLMTVNLLSPLAVTSKNGNGNTTVRLYFNSAVTGGSADHPCDLTFRKSNTGWNHMAIFFMSNDNDFRGDITIYDGTGSSCDTRLRIGHSNTSSWNDHALGDPANQINLFGSQTSISLTKFDTVNGLRHRVNGNGTILCAQYDSWDVASYLRLALDDGFVCAPCTATSIYGTMSMTAKPVEWRSAAVLLADVGFDGSGKPVSDCVSMNSQAATVFSGTVEMVEHGDIPPGTAYTIIRVNKSAGSFAFNPHSVSEGWTFQCEGNADNGWTVVATKTRDGADVSNYAASMVADDHFTANCEVTAMGGQQSVDVRVYYGTTDGGDNAAAWDTFADYPAVEAKGMYSKILTGLTEGETYYYRHAVMVDGEPVFSLDQARSVETVPVSNPDNFTWVVRAADWEGDGVWSINTAYERHTPGYAGDVVKFVYDSARTAQVPTLSADATVGRMQFSGGDWNAHYSATFKSVEPVELIFDNLGNGAGVSISGSGTEYVNFGTGTDNALTVRFNDDFTFERNAAFDFKAYFYAKLTGGTTESPHTLTFHDFANEYATVQITLLNDANDFVGDIVLKKSTYYSNGSPFTFRVGDSSHPYAESMLGDAANAVSVGQWTILEIGAGCATAVMNRSLSGGGTLKAVCPLVLGETASVHVRPGETFSVTSTGAIADDSGTGYEIGIDADDSGSAGRIDFSAVGSLTLAGTFTVTPDDPEAKIARGTRWTVGAVAAGSGLSAGAGRVSFRSPGEFKVYAEGDDENGWTIYAERRSGLMLLVR